jgi:hypothetical protein
MEYTQDPTVDAVVSRIIERSEQGIEKYGQTIRENNTKTLVEWIDDAQEEAYDMIIYLEKLKERLKVYGVGNFQ